MKLYSERPGASVSMGDDPELRNLLMHVMEYDKIEYVIETGTYNGLGSTTFVAECLAMASPPERFVTIEANWRFWRQAKRNLRRFQFITCLWGMSVALKEGLEFIRNDELLRHHEQCEDIFIDNIDDPVGSYTRELLGGSGWAGRRNPLRYLMDRRKHYDGEGLLEKWLREFRHSNPLVILDSAGGMGLLEFRILLETMGDSSYRVLLDDVNHIKHYRSLKHIESAPAFEVLGLSENNGWVFARHAQVASGCEGK